MSWASRLAWSNGYRSIQRLLATEGFIVPRVSDVGQEKFRRPLVRLAGFSDALLVSLTLRTFPPSSYGTQRGVGRGSRWVLRGDAAESSNPHQVCPECLASDEIPYWTMNSRRSYVTQCAKHGTALLSHCPECADPLTISKTRTTELHQCSTCRFDLRCAESSALSPANQVPQHWIDFNAVMPHPCTPGHIEKRAFWTGVKVVLDALSRHVIAVPLTSAPAVERFSWLFRTLAAHPHWSFDQHDVNCRHQALLFMKWLLEDWDSRISFIQSIRGVRDAIKYSHTSEVTWVHEYFHARISAARVSSKERYARSLVKPA